MIEQDTIKLLRECDAGVKMAISSIDEVLLYVSDEGFKNKLNHCRDEHHKLDDELQSLLDKYHDDGKEPQPIAKVKAGPTKTMAPRNPETVEIIQLTEPKDVRDNLDPVYEQLVDAIEGAELLIKPEETLRVMKVMEAAFESAAKGKSIDVNI